MTIRSIRDWWDGGSRSRSATPHPRGPRRRRAGLRPRADIRPPPHRDRARARPRAAGAARSTGPGRSRAPVLERIRPTHSGMTSAAELGHLFRALEGASGGARPAQARRAGPDRRAGLRALRRCAAWDRDELGELGQGVRRAHPRRALPQAQDSRGVRLGPSSAR